ncbi:monocarboxylate transporter 5-like isoform X2 [Clavelina lepadiformis]
MALGMIISSFADSVLTLCFSFGLVAGFGTGFLAFASCGIINDYFLHDRLLAEGVIGGGLCLGTFGFSLLQQFLQNLYQWQGSLLLAGAVCFHGCLTSMFFIRGNEIANHPFNMWSKSENIQQKQMQDSFNDEQVKGNEKYEAQSGDMDTTNHTTSERRRKQKGLGFLRRSFRLWQNPMFMLLILSDIVSWLATFIPYVHIVDRGRLCNLDENTAAKLSSAIGLAGIVGRPLTGILGNYLRIHPLWCYCAIQMTCGLATFLSSFWSDVYGLFAFAVIFGLSSNGYGMIKASVAVTLGKDHFVDALSWMLLEEGIGIALGPMLAGLIYDVTGSYNWSFRFSGALLMFSALMCLLKPFIERCQQDTNQQEVTYADENENIVL